MSLDSEQIEDEEFYNKRIALKILRFRSKPRQDIKPEEFKEASMKDMASSGQVANFRKKCQDTHSSLVSRGSDRPKSKDSQKPTKEVDDMPKAEADDSMKTDEGAKAQATKEQAEERLEAQKARYGARQAAIQDMKNTPAFEPCYFLSEYGTNFLEANPPKDLPPEVLMRMSQRIKRA